MKKIILEKVMVDNGYPDYGHYEWVLISKSKRKNKFFQKLFGDKSEKLIWYGEQKPNEDTIEKDIKFYS